MATRLTASKVPALAPGDHTDTDVMGLQLRVKDTRRGRQRRWLFRYTWQGQTVRLAVGAFPQMSLALARDRAKELRARLDEGIDPRKARPRRRRGAPVEPIPAGGQDRHSFDFLVSEFILRHVRAQVVDRTTGESRPRMRRPELTERLLIHDALKEWTGRDARTITPEDVLDLTDAIVARGAPVVANRTATALTQLFKFGVQRRIVSTSPVLLLTPPGGEERPRTRTLLDAELRTFFAALGGLTPPQLEPVALALLATGQRRAELAVAQWRNVDLQERVWVLPDKDVKTYRGHLVPLSAFAVEQFQVLKKYARGSAWVLPARDARTNPIKPPCPSAWLLEARPTLNGLQLEPFTLHDLRRTCRTGMARLKVERRFAELVLNHTKRGMEGVYDQEQYLDEKRAALDKWGAHLAKLAHAAGERESAAKSDA
jgi:integrase